MDTALCVILKYLFQYVLWINIETLRLEEGENFRTQPEDEWPKAVQAEIIMIILSFSSFKQTYYNLQ